MFRASKLCQWSSTSGPSATVKPSRPMMSFNSSIVCVMGWRWPRRGCGPGTVGSKAPAAATAFPPGDAPAGLFQGGLDLLLDGVEPQAGGRFVGLVDRAEPLLHGLEPSALGAEELESAPPRPPRRRRRRPARRRPPRARSSSSARNSGSAIVWARGLHVYGGLSRFSPRKWDCPLRPAADG